MGHTTFIVGAGASCEFGLVDGARLRDRIATGLDQYQFTGIWMGREEGWQAKSTLASALRTALSIDDCMHTHQANPLIQQLGKWGIVHEILSQERESCLTLDPQGVNFTAKRLSRGKDGESLLFDTWSSWLVSLFRLLTAECTVDEIPDRMSRVSFIVFNYDRCIEHALVHLLTMKLGGNREAASTIARDVDIVHPYGCLGAPWERAFPFGLEPDRAPYQAMTARIRTFTVTVA